LKSIPLLIAVLLAGPFCALASEPRSEVAGLWSGGDSLLLIEEREGTLSARVMALRDAYYREDEGLGEPGTLRRDDNNPDEAHKGRVVLGLELLSDYEFKGRRWQGRIYDPGSGNTYSSRMEVEDGRLKMRGYIGVPMLGRTQYFEPVEGCTEPVRDMVETSWAELALCD
jgi:hypothetical protein